MENTMKSGIEYFVIVCLMMNIMSSFYIQALQAQGAPVPTGLLQEMHFREIGPAVTGGRIHDVEALPEDPSTIYIATATGGIWKSVNKGTTWSAIFEGQATSTLGDLAIAPSDRNTIWAGTGEQNNRQSTSWGNGVYRSDDGGSTWTHLGLVETRHIGRIRVHPENPDIAFVAALGNLWKASDERGVYKTSDGGGTWEKVLFLDEYTGVVDLVMNPSDPNTLYAAAYQRLRRTWGFNGGGPGSGIHKTTDGGESWYELTNGIPTGDKGRIGLANAQTQHCVLYATIEHAEEGGVYRTSDCGETWERVNDLNPRPAYYSHIFIDPTDENRVYVLGVQYYMSIDGGSTFRQMPTRPAYDVGVHSDFHTMWINPNDPEHFYLAGDAGLHETWDGGETYIRINNISIGQFYAVGVDSRDPYYIYGGMQDNHSWMGPSATRRWIGIVNDDWWQIGFGDGMYQQPDPDDPRTVYVTAQNGVIVRLDSETGDQRDIRPYPGEDEDPYRFDWVTPGLVSRHNPSTIYVGGNRLFISHDSGESWEATADLTRNINRDSLDLMGVSGSVRMLSKNDGTSSYGEIVSIAESPIDPNILWIGTDDGYIQVSRDGGETWMEISERIMGVPDGTYVSRVIASARFPGGAYVTFDAHRDGDFAPYVYKTTDYGLSWTKRVDGLPPEGSVNVILEYTKQPDLLFLGTEHGLFVSYNASLRWMPFRANLPTTLYDDLVIHPRDHDLIVATHGRGIWILDDITPLAEWSATRSMPASTLYPIQPATIFQYWKATSYRGQAAYAGENPPFGAIISYFLTDPVEASISIRNSAGTEVRQLSASSKQGVIHRLTWDLRHEPPPYAEETTETLGLIMSERILPVLPHPTDPVGPFVSPGIYTAILQAGPLTVRQSFEVLGDPELSITDIQWNDREIFLLEVLALQRASWSYSDQAKVVRDSLTTALDEQEASDTLQAHADSVDATYSRLRRIRSQIYSLAGELNGRDVRQGSLYPPTATQRRRLKQLEALLNQEVEIWKNVKIGG